MRGKEEAGKTGKEGLPDQRGRRKTKELTLTFFRLVDGKYVKWRGKLRTIFACLYNIIKKYNIIVVFLICVHKY